MNSFNNFQPAPSGQFPQINPEQFRIAISKLDDNMLNNLAQQARFLGMTNEQIQEGLRYIQSMK